MRFQFYKQIQKPFDPIPVDAGVPENLTRGFILSNCNLEVVSAEVLFTACSVFFFVIDKELISLLFILSRSEKKIKLFFLIEEFSSFRFSSLYLSEYFPKSTQRISFGSGSDNMEALYVCMDNVINFYNENGGFIIIGWYKRGEINDSIQINENEKVTSSIMNYHVTAIHPTKYIHDNAKETKVMKFDILEIE